MLQELLLLLFSLSGYLFLLRQKDDYTDANEWLNEPVKLDLDHE